MSVLNTPFLTGPLALVSHLGALQRPRSGGWSQGQWELSTIHSTSEATKRGRQSVRLSAHRVGMHDKGAKDVYRDKQSRRKNPGIRQ